MMKIFNEDCLSGMLQLPENSVDFILSDLPYGVVSYKQDKKINLAEMWKQFKRILKYFPQGLKAATIIKANGDSTICLSNCKHKGDDRKKFGRIYHASPSNKIYRQQDFTGYPSDILYFDAPYNGKKFHPSEKPVDLLEYLICTYTREGETVLDATCGSGSTGVACVNTNRNFIGYEIDEKFFGIAESRIEQALREKAQRLF